VAPAPSRSVLLNGRDTNCCDEENETQPTLGFKSEASRSETPKKQVDDFCFAVGALSKI